MFEKVNPSHPDKVADRIAGAIVDMCYAKQKNPKVAVEVLIGHGNCHVIVETSVEYNKSFEDGVDAIVKRIAGEGVKLDLQVVQQDVHLAKNQSSKVRCGDNGIFKGVPTTREQKELSRIAHCIYDAYPTDGKYILDWFNSSDFSDGQKLIICQSNAESDELSKLFPDAIVNPLGDWTGGPNVDSGATNRKLGSDMGDGVTGGGLHGKDLSKADVSVNICAHIIAQRNNCTVDACCAIGDDAIHFICYNGNTYSLGYDEVVAMAEQYIEQIGGFEKFAEWGLI